jgi:hypothetical protein
MRQNSNKLAGKVTMNGSFTQSRPVFGLILTPVLYVVIGKLTAKPKAESQTAVDAVLSPTQPPSPKYGFSSCYRNGCGAGLTRWRICLDRHDLENQ